MQIQIYLYKIRYSNPNPNRQKKTKTIPSDFTVHDLTLAFPFTKQTFKKNCTNCRILPILSVVLQNGKINTAWRALYPAENVAREYSQAENLLAVPAYQNNISKLSGYFQSWSVSC